MFDEYYENIPDSDFVYMLKSILYNYQFIKPKYVFNNAIRVPQKSVLDLYKIDLMNHRKARLAVYYHLHMQPSEIDNMFYYDFEDLLMDLSDMLKEKADAEKKAYGDQKEQSQVKQPKMPKMPTMPKFK